MLKPFVAPLILCCAGLLLFGFMTRDHGIVAHEWGTFTSVQGSDGVALEWRPLETSHLPKFVYNWGNPGLNRRGTSPLIFGKGGMVTLQRMETPVIYFYADHEEAVDVSVSFPNGFITEWYPQAAQIGPSTIPASPAVLKLDEYAHKAGAKPSFTFAALFENRNVKESRVRWANVRILPEKGKREGILPAFDPSGSHYYAARDTDANYLRVSSLEATNPSPEHEKFIFYRGVGNFGTPLQVSMRTDRSLTLSNGSPEALVHLFVLEVSNGAGRFTAVRKLSAGTPLTLQLDAAKPARDLKIVTNELREQVVDGLISQGLYRREAIAMVNTWKDSWFGEEGLRVIYLLPRAWTDRTLPMALDPAPRELVRVMVGRAEVISPVLQRGLADSLTQAQKGDAAAKEQALAELKKLGRFAEPAVRLATRGTAPEVSQTGWTLLWSSAQPGRLTAPL